MKNQPNYKNKRILLTAFSVEEGSEAVASYNFLKKFGANDITTLYWGSNEYSNKIPNDVKKIKIDGPDFDKSLTKNYDLVFRHQTINPSQILSPHTTNTIEFMKHCPATVIGITGTKGKGTTATLIHEILIKSGINSHLLGNIGKTAIAELENISQDDVVCFEMSSFQLWDLKQSPHISVVLMIDEDHLDVHDSFEDYLNAKSNIARYQSSEDYTFYHPKNNNSVKVASVGEGQKFAFMSEDYAHVDDGKIYIGNKKIIDVNGVGLLGVHNQENICAALSASSLLTDDAPAMASAIREFRGLEHRLEFVGEVNGIKYINDSFAAATPATIAAIKSFDQPEILILGGVDRGVSYTNLIDEVVSNNIKHIVLIGENKYKLEKLLAEHGVHNFNISNALSMADIINEANEYAEKGDVVLLSPASPSFDMFKNYKDRGTKFKAAVKELSKNENR